MHPVLLTYTSYLFYPSQHNPQNLVLINLYNECIDFSGVLLHVSADKHYQLILKLLYCYLHGYMLQYYNYY
jgi:hypothetical protein